MNFKTFKAAVQRQFNTMKSLPLFRVALDKDKLWERYLSSFPEGTNLIYKKRTQHDCSCCRSFIKNVGDIVAIKDGKLISIWDISITGADAGYQVVADALGEFVRSLPIENIFLHREERVGVDCNRAQAEDGTVITWEHFSVMLPAELVARGIDMGAKLSEARASHDVLLRSLTEIKPDAVETVQELIASNSLYRGAEKKALVDAFAKMQGKFHQITAAQAAAGAADLFVWEHIRGPTAFASRIRNDVIGTLLVDLSEGLDLEDAVKRFEDKVSGTNYKRPTALITPKMRDAAKAKLIELGLLPALDRRYAVLEDIKVTNVLFANRDAKKRMAGDVFDALPTKGADPTKLLEKVEEISINDFVANVLGKVKSLEVLVENRHLGNLVSLTAPCDLTAPSLFKWPNPFAWSYNGDMADAIKERVKKAGGNVDGDVCCRLSWENSDDLDFHMTEPTGVSRRSAYNGVEGHYDIGYINRRIVSPNGGVLDVDANGADGPRPDPCENIVYVNKKTMRLGRYVLYVHQYSQRNTADVGFEAEIDVGGQVFRFAYPKAVKQGERVDVADLVVVEDGIKVEPKLVCSTASKEVWGLKTQTFVPVQAMMLSPNFWDGKEIGNKHFFFMLDGCKNDGQARGFYNEFLKSDLEAHRKTMEMVGANMKAEQSDNQLSGVGFSSTARNSVLCRVGGSFTRVLKVVF